METTLDNICRNYLAKNGYNTLHHYVKCMRHLVDFLRDVSLSHSIFDKTVVLRLDSKKAVQFPSDMVTWTKLGWQKGDRIIAFQKDSSINLHHDTEADGPSETVNDAYDINSPWPYNGSFTPTTFNNYWYNNGAGSLSGYAVGTNGLGYFRPNYSAKEFQFSSDVPADFEIYLEYRCNGFKPRTKSVVPEVLGRVAEDYIHWQLARFDRRMGDSSSETEGRRLAYQREYNKALSQMNPTVFADIIGAKARAFHVNKLVG